MAYNFLVNAAKKRIITELREHFAKHPRFNKLEIVNRFPYDERIQQGIIVRNISAGRIPLSADNFQGNVYSYVNLANHNNAPGLSIQWVREDTRNLANWVVREDFSHQFENFPQENVTIILNDNFVKSNSELDFASHHRSVQVFVNNQKVIPKVVNGEARQIILPSKPCANAKVEVSYWSRNMAPAGIYQIEIVSGDPETRKFEFLVDPMIEKKEVLLNSAKGDETSFRVNNGSPIFKGSFRIIENDTILKENEDYLIDYETGIVTLMQNPPLLRGSKLTAIYRTRGLTMGPFKINEPYQADFTAIPGVVMCFGNATSIGDKHFVIITDKREINGLEYSGKWDLSVSLEVYAKDSFAIEEIVDLTTSALLFYRKEELDAEGIALVDVSFGGESEQIFDEATGDLYYNGSVDYQFMTEWILVKPLLRTVDGFNLEVLDIVEKDEVIPKDEIDFARIR
jgi:hypothetical protein